MYHYPEDLHLDERDDYRYAIDPSKASEWQREQVARIFGGVGVQPPSTFEVRHKYLDIGYKEMKESHNFPKNDSSDKIKDHQYIYGLLKYVVKEVGEKNVVQIVTDNGSAFVKVAYYLNPKYQYIDNIGDNSELFKAVHIVYTQLDLEAMGIANFGNELKLRDMTAKKDKVDETDIMDLLQVAAEAGDDNENPIFDWVRPAYLDDDERNHDPHIAYHARDMGINVEQVIREEVGVDRGVTASSSSNDQHTSSGNSGNSGGKDDRDDGD
ncbi:hypothetical protein Dsin_019712 [Dipteronia sinensis]|uniref:DUF659 domain-containing protein n=1 Tax=Dipteronia sinensis TaxID=43782 RepID=A0AAE0A977_9ROSI|nr:hypothetical protein Dsin_019712 [Dipteronia sinensis]